MLNYVYAILESEARLAISELGLNPGIGFLHSDTLVAESIGLKATVEPKVT
jgi:CRISPR/Cas system-associated endonuclease Cas1